MGGITIFTLADTTITVYDEDRLDRSSIRGPHTVLEEVLHYRSDSSSILYVTTGSSSISTCSEHPIAFSGSQRTRTSCISS